MKTIEVTYDTDGYIKDLSDNCIHFEQENDSLVVNAEITTDKKVRAYIRASNNNSTVTDDEIEKVERSFNVSLSSNGVPHITLDYYPDIEVSCGNGIIPFGEKKEKMTIEAPVPSSWKGIF